MGKDSTHFNEYLYPKIIQPTIHLIENNLNAEFKESVDFYSYANDPAYIRRLSSFYEEKREWLKNAYFGKYTQSSSLLDMHKIAAILCRSIIAHKPFAFDVSKANKLKDHIDEMQRLQWAIDNFWANYRVAFGVALCTIMYDMIDKLGSLAKNPEQTIYGIDAKDVIRHVSSNGFDMYDKENVLLPISHESFYRSVIINLAINDTNGRDFDYLGFATICFQMQQYTVLKFEYDKLFNATKKDTPLE